MQLPAESVMGGATRVQSQMACEARRMNVSGTSAPSDLIRNQQAHGATSSLGFQGSVHPVSAA